MKNFTPEKAATFYGATAVEWLARWDDGRSCWSLEMGGLGPGYEQAIQVLVAELIRDQHDKPLPAEGDQEAWWAWGNDTVKRIDGECLGFSGAQVGAAKSLAYNLIKKGPVAFFTEVQEAGKWEERSIQVSNKWPRAPIPTNEPRR